MAKVCIISGERVQKGYPVADDFVIRSIRSVKKRLGIAKNNTLVVSHEKLEEYRKKREKYEKDLVMHIVLAGFVLVLFVLLPIFTTGFSITALLLGIVLAAMIVGLSVFSHCPRIEAKGIGKKKRKR